MTKTRYNKFRELFGIGNNFENAINFLFWAPRLFVLRNMGTFRIQDYTTPLSELPAEVQFPDSLKGKIWYDGIKGELHFHGAMTESEKVTLKALDPANDPESPYQKAINDLYDRPNSRLQSSEIFLSVPSPYDSSTPVALSYDTTADTALIFDKPCSPAERFGYVLRKIMPYLRTTLNERLVKQKLSDALKVEMAIADKLLTSYVSSVSDPSQRAIREYLDLNFADSSLLLESTRERYPSQFDTYVRLDKISRIISRFGFTPKQLGWIYAYGSDAGWLDIWWKLPLVRTTCSKEVAEAFLRLADLQTVRDMLPAGETVLDELFRYSHSIWNDDTEKNESKTKYIETIARATKWPESDLEYLVGIKNSYSDSGHLHVSFPDGYYDERILVRLRACALLLKRVGLSAKLCCDLAKPDIDETIARSALLAVKGKYTDDQWLSVAKPLRDVLREKQRAALVAYHVTHPKSIEQLDGKNTPAWRKVNELYAYLLIDVEMSPCMMTSRIKQAISSVQLFVQRCLMGLEPEVRVDANVDERWLWWKWMKNYRVWEANRKIFVYPENWIEPELRDDKSPFFRELESELLQNELTNDTAEAAFMHYLGKLDTVARLEIVGMYHYVEPTDGTPNGAVDVDNLHVFGRTRNTPHVYYYRKRVDSSYWTAWEKVDLDIEGDHLIPVVWNGRLYLFWPVFTEKQEETDITMPSADQSLSKGATYWEIKIAWSEYKKGKWTAKKITSEWLYSFYHPDTTGLSKTEEILSKTEEILHYKFGAIPNWYNNILYIWFVTPYHFEREDKTIWIGGAYKFLGENEEALSEEIWVWEPSPLLQSGLLLTETSRNMFIEKPVSEGPLYLPNRQFDDVSEYTSSMVHVLEKTPGFGPFYVLYPHQDFTITAKRPFFYQDDTKTFFVIPEPIKDSTALFAKHAIPSGFTIELPPIYCLPGVNYRFKMFYHPRVNEFISRLNRKGIDEFLKRDVQINVTPFFEMYFPSKYVVKGDPTVDDPFPAYPKEDVDFSYDGAYSLYNWELFFHAPFLIAERLSRNQRFEDAQKWYHYIFDPTDMSKNPVPQRYWRTKPFFEKTSEEYYDQKLPNMFRYLATRDPADLTRSQKEEQDNLKKYIEQWRNDPFKPHIVARLRDTAYQKAVVMKYIDNLIAWGDQLFRRYTIETINEATQCYILAADLLGKRPEIVPPRQIPKVQTFDAISPDLDEFANALVEIEEFVPPSDGPVTAVSSDTPKPPVMLYFCIPKNEELLGYWDTVADRLFKIRHCMNIEGIERQLPLFEPPIEPSLLVKAIAAGIDISSALCDINASLPHYRFSAMTQKAGELCGEVRALGSELLSALEKRDAEKISLLRSTHELKVLDAVRLVRDLQINEAAETLEGLIRYRAVADERLKYYEKLLKETINAYEQAHLNLIEQSLGLQQAQMMMEYIANFLCMIPDVKIGTPTTLGATLGGSGLGGAMKAMGAYMGSLVSILNSTASLSLTKGGYVRREEEWNHQKLLAEKELKQVEKQIAAAEIRRAIAEQELKNHDLQVENAKELDAAMHDKFTNQELYDWTVGQISGIYFQSYQMAYDVAKKAERAYRHELGLDTSDFIRFGYWDSLKKGLLAGERLSHDLKRMEVAYLDQNKREYEITKHVSLAMLDPYALVQLRETGRCFVNLPEALFDLDYPGHYMRRIRSVSLTVPCITGPYTGINCTLTLIKHSVRKSTSTDGGYIRTELDDNRFSDSIGTIESIATSGAQNDSGLFEFNFRDERYLPFEGAGAISEWRIELPSIFRQFDYNTISDVILHIRYTARDGGTQLKEAVVTDVKQNIDSIMALAENRNGFYRLFSIRHEFPSEWHKLMNPKKGELTRIMEFKLSSDRFPFVFQTKTIWINQIELFLKIQDRIIPDSNPNKKYLEDYANGTQLKITLMPFMSDSCCLESSPLIMGGTPYLVIPLESPSEIPITCKFEIKEEDITPIASSLRQEITIDNETHYILNPDAFQDFFILCRYSIST
jgi:hypothetical protein